MHRSIRSFAPALAALALLACNPAPTGAGSSTAGPHKGVAKPKSGFGQLPADTKIAIAAETDRGLEDYIRAAVPGGDCGMYIAGTEYWDKLSTASRPVLTSLTLTASQMTSRGKECENDLLAFLDRDLKRLFSTPQRPTWSTQLYRPEKPWVLYSAAPDQQATSKKIGLLIELDDRGALQGISWYKSSDVDPGTDPVFRVGAPTTTMTFKTVKQGEAGAPVDPKVIDPEATGQWYRSGGLLSPPPH